MPQMTRGALMKVSAAGAMGWAAGMANVARAGGETPISEILGCPTDRTMCLNIQGASALEAYVEYGTGSFDARTPLVAGYEGGPTGFCLEGLQPDTRYGYRTRYRVREPPGPLQPGQNARSTPSDWPAMGSPSQFRVTRTRNGRVPSLTMRCMRRHSETSR